jgi:hypothetical protein
MERCPSCGSAARPGAKFCTTCGYRFADNGDAEPLLDPETSSTTDATPAPDDILAGWPSAPSPAGDPQPEIAASETSAVIVASSSDAVSANASSPWPAPPETAWPTPPDLFGSAAGDDRAVPDDTAATDRMSVGDTAEPLPIARAERLLGELQEALAEISHASAIDLSGVLSDLEVALAPPEVIAGEALSELRDALFAAKENPRDVDTIVDLTRRIDALVALVIAYDRAIAALERAQSAIRRVSA